MFRPAVPVENEEDSNYGLVEWKSTKVLWPVKSCRKKNKPAARFLDSNATVTLTGKKKLIPLSIDSSRNNYQQCHKDDKVNYRTAIKNLPKKYHEVLKKS